MVCEGQELALSGYCLDMAHPAICVNPSTQATGPFIVRTGSSSTTRIWQNLVRLTHQVEGLSHCNHFAHLLQTGEMRISS